MKKKLLSMFMAGAILLGIGGISVNAHRLNDNNSNSYQQHTRYESCGSKKCKGAVTRQEYDYGGFWRCTNCHEEI